MSRILLTAVMFAAFLLGCGTQFDGPELIGSEQGGAYQLAPPLPPPAPDPAPKLRPIRVWMSPDIRHPDGVRSGVAGWAETTRGVREWAYVDDDAETVLYDGAADVAIYEAGKYARICDGQVETGALGCAKGAGLWDNESGAPLEMWLITGAYDANPAFVTMHELGHLLGLHHEDGGIMQAVATKAMLAATWECPDAGSVEQLAEHFGLDGLTACAPPVGGAA